MSRLPIDYPEVHQQFMQGGFSVKFVAIGGGSNPFDHILVDQTIEETVNQDTQTAEGTKGFSLKWSAVERYYLTYISTAVCTRGSSEKMVGLGMSHLSHPDLHITSDEADIVKPLDESFRPK